MTQKAHRIRGSSPGKPAPEYIEDMLAMLPPGKSIFDHYRSEDLLKPLSDSLLEEIPPDQLKQLLFHRRSLRTALHYNDHMDDTQIAAEQNTHTTRLRIIFEEIYATCDWFLHPVQSTNHDNTCTGNIWMFCPPYPARILRGGQNIRGGKTFGFRF